MAEKKREADVRAALGTKGAQVASSFFERAKAAGKKPSAVCPQAKVGAAPPPEVPPPPPLLARLTAVTPPPLVPLLALGAAPEPFHVRLQKLVLSHFSSEAPEPLYICPGYLLELPNPAVMNYPYGLCDVLDRAGQPGVTCDISWSAPDDDGRVRSKSCLLKTPADDEPCEKCGL